MNADAPTPARESALDPQASPGALGRRRLILARCDERFDPSHEVALGPWCFVGREDAYAGWEDLPFLKPFETREEVRDHYRRCVRLFRKRLCELYPELNRRHGTDYGRAYWHHLAGPWLLCLTLYTWSRYRHVEKFLERHANVDLDVDLAREDMDWKPFNTFEFQERFRADSNFHFWLLSCMVRRLAPKETTVTEVPLQASPFGTDVGPEHEPPQPPDRTWLQRLLGLPGFDRCRDVYGMDARTQALMSLLLAVRPRKAPKVRDEDWDCYDPREEFPRTYLELLEGFIERTMPRTFGDEYARFREVALRWRYAKGRIRIWHPDYWRDEKKFVTAEAIERGECIVRAQHGCFYGVVEAHAMPAEFELGHDAFITWGWREYDDHPGTFVPLPSPLLSAGKDAHLDRTGKALYVGTVLDLSRDGVTEAPGADVVAYRRSKVRFLNLLRPEVLDHIRYRPYPSKAFLRDEEYVAERARSFPILDHDPKPDMFAVKLFLLDYYGTLLHVALAGNIPTIAYWADDRRPLVTQAEPLFAQLRDCGILFDSPEAAATAVNAVWDDVSSWWQRPEVQGARRAWCERYAWADEAWRWKWARALWSL